MINYQLKNSRIPHIWTRRADCATSVQKLVWVKSLVKLTGAVRKKEKQKSETPDFVAFILIYLFNFSLILWPFAMMHS